MTTYTITAELLQELISNCMASIAEEGISDARRVYRTELHHRANLAMRNLQPNTQEPVGEIMHLDELNETWTKHLPIGTKLYTAPQSEDDKALHKLGCEMLAMTTTVHSPHIPFVEQCALVPSVWQKFFDDNKVQSTPQQPAEVVELQAKLSAAEARERQTRATLHKFMANQQQQPAEPVSHETFDVSGDKTPLHEVESMIANALAAHGVKP